MSHLKQLGRQAAGRIARLVQHAGRRKQQAGSSQQQLRLAGLERPQPTKRRTDLQVARARRSLSRELQQLKEEKKDIALEEVAPTVTELSWQRPLRVLLYPDPRLRAVNANIGVFDSSLKQLAQEMFEVMYEDDGVGLAAPQVGVNLRLMVFNPTGIKGKGEEIVLVNPRVVGSSKQTEVEEEGCLSFPDMNADVERALKVKVKAQTMEGKKFVLELAGWQARIFQHEYDHLQGVLFHDRMTPLVLDTVRDNLVALEEKFIAANPGVEVRRLR